MKKIEKTFKALANYKRLEILAFINKNKNAPVGEALACALSRRLSNERTRAWFDALLFKR